MSMQSLRDGYRAIVVGGSGSVGGTFVKQLGDDPHCARVISLHRHSTPPVDYDDWTSIDAVAAALSADGPFDLIVVATGVLHTESLTPEKKLADLNAEQLEKTFRINTFGPALMLKALVPLLTHDRAVFAVLSAKVGSIGDNRLGGWYSYRASKAALNMMLKTAAIEVRRTRPAAILVALHPGTVKSKLSRPFKGDTIGRHPDDAVSDLLGVLDRCTADHSGGFLSYTAETLPW